VRGNRLQELVFRGGSLLRASVGTLFVDLEAAQIAHQLVLGVLSRRLLN